MKKTTFIAAILLSGFFAINAAAQKPAANSQPKAPAQSGSKIDKKIGQADSAIKKTEETIKKTEETVKKVTDWFKKLKTPPTEALVVIPAIEFEDANLESLANAINERKEVKKSSVEYADGTATIRIVLKGKNKFDFWNDLPKEVTNAFKMKSNVEGNILVELKPAAVSAQIARN